VHWETKLNPIQSDELRSFNWTGFGISLLLLKNQHFLNPFRWNLVQSLYTSSNPKAAETRKILNNQDSRNQNKPRKKKSILIPENKKSYDKEKKGNAKSNEYGRERESTCLREEITTEAPSNPNLSAMEKPIPWVEAVTITTFPSNLFPLIILLVILPSLISLSRLQITRQDKLQKQSWFLQEILLLLWLMKQISDNLKIY